MSWPPGLAVHAGWAWLAGLAGLACMLWAAGEDSKEYIVACIFKHMFAHMCSMQSIHPEAANIHNSQLRE